MVEPEVAFATLAEITELAEDLIISIIARILETRKEELKILERETAPLEDVKKPFHRITYDEILPKLLEKGSKIQWGDDFGAPEESILSEIYDTPVCVTHFPAKIKAFYMQPDEENPDLVLGVDVFASEGFGELIGG